MTISIVDNTIPTGQEYSDLIATTGWEGVVEKGYNKLYEAISNSWYLVCAYDGDRLVGSGRIVADGVYQAFITDVLVLPEYQDKGIGKAIVKKLLQKCKDDDVLLVSLFAAKDMSPYYQKMGFVDRAPDCPGMRWVDRNIDDYGAQ